MRPCAGKFFKQVSLYVGGHPRPLVCYAEANQVSSTSSAFISAETDSDLRLIRAMLQGIVE